MVHGVDGAPVLRVHGALAEAAQARGVDRWLVTLTHTDTLAMASVLAGRAFPRG